MVGGRKEIIYPIFLQCCQYATDAFWENTFEDLAYGKTPYGSYISKGFICCTTKKKKASCKIEKHNPKQMHDDVYNLLVTELGLLSQREKAKRKLEFQDLEEQLQESCQEWAKLRKKNVKKALIERFVIQMKEEHSLSLQQARHLLSAITLAMSFKVITPKDIDYSDNMIHSIDGVTVKKGEVEVTVDIYGIDVTYAQQAVADKKLMVTAWEKYIKELKRFSKKRST